MPTGTDDLSKLTVQDVIGRCERSVDALIDDHRPQAVQRALRDVLIALHVLAAKLPPS